MEIVKCTLENRVAFLEMRNSKKLNCLGSELCDELINGFQSLKNEDIFAIVICAEKGCKVWSAGHDIKELPTDSNDPLSFNVAMEKLLREVQNAVVPVIALVEGSVWGGACDLCTVCDMIVASDTSTFAITPAKIGIPYNTSGIMHFVNTMSLNKAKEMFFTASPISAHDAYNMGFVNYIASADKIREVLEEKILGKMRNNSVLAISAIKRQFSLLTRATANLPMEAFENIQDIRRLAYQDGADYIEGITAFLEKRKPMFKGKARDLDAILEKDKKI